MTSIECVCWGWLLSCRICAITFSSADWKPLTQSHLLVRFLQFNLIHVFVLELEPWPLPNSTPQWIPNLDLQVEDSESKKENVCLGYCILFLSAATFSTPSFIMHTYAMTRLHIQCRLSLWFVLLKAVGWSVHLLCLAVILIGSIQS